MCPQLLGSPGCYMRSQLSLTFRQRPCSVATSAVGNSGLLGAMAGPWTVLEGAFLGHSPEATRARMPAPIPRPRAALLHCVTGHTWSMEMARPCASQEPQPLGTGEAYIQELTCPSHQRGPRAGATQGWWKEEDHCHWGQGPPHPLVDTAADDPG